MNDIDQAKSIWEEALEFLDDQPANHKAKKLIKIALYELAM